MPTCRGAREALPELPGERRERYRDALGLPEDVATQLAFEAELGAYFEDVVAAATDGAEARAIANWVAGELAAELREAGEERAIEANAGAAEKVREGNAKAIGPIVGAVMKETKGRADGGEITKLIREKLGL